MSPTRTVRNAFSAASAVGLFLPPVPDQQERAQAHDLPAEDQLHHVLGEHHRQHARTEQRERCEEVGVAAVAAHVLERVDLHERGDERDEQQHHDGQAIDVLAEPELDPADLPPRPRLDDRFGFVRRRVRSGSTDRRRRSRCTSAATMLAMPTSAPAHRNTRLPLISNLPNRMMTAKATPGISGISQACSRNQPAEWTTSSAASIRSALHFRELVERDALAVAVDQQHHRQADADLGGGDRDDVQARRRCRRGCLCSWLNASRLMLTELRISSIDISTITAFFRAITPYTPMQNSTAPSNRNSLTNTANPSWPERWRR